MVVQVPEVEAVLEQLRAVLLEWHKRDTLGEVAIVRGYHELQIEERPRRKHKAVKREEGSNRTPVRAR